MEKNQDNQQSGEPAATTPPTDVDAAFATEQGAEATQAPQPQEGKVRRREINAQVRAERIVNESPYGRLMKFVQEHGLEQFKVVLKRKQADGVTFSLLKTYSLSPEQIDTMPEWVGTEFGGGTFEVSIANPTDPQERYIDYEFSIEGAPIEPKRPLPQAQGVPQPYQQFVQPGQTPGQQPMGIAGYPQQGGMVMGPQMYRQAYAYQHPTTNPEVEALKATVKTLTDQIQRERDAAQLKSLQDGFERRLSELQVTQRQEMQAVLSKLEQIGTPRRDHDGEHMKEMFGMFMKQAEMQQATTTMMLTRQSDDRREQLDNMRKQMEMDLQFRKEMWEQAEKSKDPSKTAALLDMMGNQTASMLNLMQQAAQAGLFGGGGDPGEPAWLKGLREGFQALQDTAGKYLQMKQQEQMMGSMRRPPQPGAPRLPAPQQPRPQQSPRPGTGTGFGQPMNRPTPQQVEQQPQPQPQQPAAPEPLSFLTVIGNFVAAIEQKAPAEEVGDMIFAFADFLRFNNMLPAEWAEVFVSPSETIGAFLEVFAPHIKPTKEYLDEIGIQILEREKENEGDKAEDKAEARPPLRVVEAPTPPVPVEETTPTTEN